MKVVLNGAVVYHLRDLLQAKLAASAEIVRLSGSETPAQRAEICHGADVLVAIKNHELPPIPGLRLLQVPGAGLDQIDLARVPTQAWVCNAYGHDIASAEYIVLGMLAAAHDFMEAHQSFKAGSWRLSGRFNAPLHEELFGKTVGVLGLGSIGLATARLAKAFGTTVIGFNRTVQGRHGFVDEVLPLDALQATLPRCDFLAVCVAQTPETTGLIGPAAFLAMKPTAVIINVARGPIIDEHALFEALRDRTIGGAVIDAWYQYPSGDDLTLRPSTLPFHELPNLIMTPHSAVWTRGMVERRWSSIAANIDAIGRGDTAALQNVVRAPAAVPSGRVT